VIRRNIIMPYSEWIHASAETAAWPMETSVTAEPMRPTRDKVDKVGVTAVTAARSVSPTTLNLSSRDDVSSLS